MYVMWLGVIFISLLTGVFLGIMISKIPWSYAKDVKVRWQFQPGLTAIELTAEKFREDVVVVIKT
jgi:hypothetical protein